jgi:GTPase KRas protein
MSISTSNKKPSYTIVMLGSGGVGKSCLTLRFVCSGYSEVYDATIEDFYLKTVNVDDETINMEIIDTAGQEEFQSMLDGWIRSADGIILVYDVSSKHTFDELSYFYERILECKGIEGGKSFPLVIVGNKCDLPLEQWKVTQFQAQTLANSWKCPYIETSAQNRINEQLCFYQIIREIKRLKTNQKTNKEDKKGYECHECHQCNLM